MLYYKANLSVKHYTLPNIHALMFYVLELNIFFDILDIFFGTGLGDKVQFDCSPDFTDKDCDKYCKETGHPGGYCGPDHAIPALRMCYCKG